MEGVDAGLGGSEVRGAGGEMGRELWLEGKTKIEICYLKFINGYGIIMFTLVHSTIFILLI